MTGNDPLSSMSNVGAAHALSDAFARGAASEYLSRFSPNIEWQLAENHPYNPKGDTWVGAT